MANNNPPVLPPIKKMNPINYSDYQKSIDPTLLMPIEPDNKNKYFDNYRYNNYKITISDNHRDLTTFMPNPPVPQLLFNHAPINLSTINRASVDHYKNYNTNLTPIPYLKDPNEAIVNGLKVYKNNYNIIKREPKKVNFKRKDIIITDTYVEERGKFENNKFNPYTVYGLDIYDKRGTNIIEPQWIQSKKLI